MLEGMLGAVIVIAAFVAGYKLRQAQKEIQVKPKTAEETKRERNFKRFMSYDGGSSAGQNDI